MIEKGIAMHYTVYDELFAVGGFLNGSQLQKALENVD